MSARQINGPVMGYVENRFGRFPVYQMTLRRGPWDGLEILWNGRDDVLGLDIDDVYIGFTVYRLNTDGDLVHWPAPLTNPDWPPLTNPNQQ